MPAVGTRGLAAALTFPVEPDTRPIRIAAAVPMAARDRRLGRDRPMDGTILVEGAQSPSIQVSQSPSTPSMMNVA